jgi:Ca2+-binding RTX toxin-like protein
MGYRRNENVPLANGMPTEDLCVKCENRKNVIQGGGLIVGTNHEDFIQGDTDILRNDQIFGKDMPDLIFGEQGMDRAYGGSGGDTVHGGLGNDQIFGEGGDDQLVLMTILL